MKSVSVHCMFCRRMSDIAVSRLQNAFSVRCDYCLALSALTEKQRDDLIARASDMVCEQWAAAALIQGVTRPRALRDLHAADGRRSRAPRLLERPATSTMRPRRRASRPAG